MKDTVHIMVVNVKDIIMEICIITMKHQMIAAKDRIAQQTMDTTGQAETTTIIHTEIIIKPYKKRLCLLNSRFYLKKSLYSNHSILPSLYHND